MSSILGAKTVEIPSLAKIGLHAYV